MFRSRQTSVEAAPPRPRAGLALLEAASGQRVTAVPARFRAAVPLGSAPGLLHAPGASTFTLVRDGKPAVEGGYAYEQEFLHGGK